MKKARKAPWKRSNPRKRHKTMSSKQKTRAKRRAKAAGRPYPNLVDNMRESARGSRKKKAAKKRVAKKKSSKKKAKKTARKRRSPEKDPKGGLTAAGRRAFARKQGAHLKPGVRKKESEMTPQEMRRKGSWAVRFYGRAKLPPLVDDNGEPTRHALSAHAWGEPVPRTMTAARKIAQKGHRLLVRYKRLKER